MTIAYEDPFSLGNNRNEYFDSEFIVMGLYFEESYLVQNLN